MPPIIVAAAITAASAVAAGGISAYGANKAANTAAKSQQDVLDAQRSAADKAAAERAAAVEVKRKAAESINYPTYLSTPEAQKYKQTLEERMAGKGVIDVNAQTSPIANQVRSGLDKTQAGLSSMASSRGLGRSTVATAQGVAASQAAERDIAERMSNLELTRQGQIDQAVSQYGTLGEQESASQQNQAIFKRGGEFSVADTMSGAASANSSDQFSIAKTIAEKGASEAAYQLKQAEIWASALNGVGSSASSFGESAKYDELIKKIERQQNQAMVQRPTGRYYSA